MEVSKNVKKILILGMILLVIAGIIVVALKGFHVSLLFGKHETIGIKLGIDVDLNQVQEVCNETFGKKEFVVKALEVFGDSVQISVESITEEEKTMLIEKLNEKFGTEKTVEDLNIVAVSNKRIRDVVKPYIVPMGVSYGIIFAYMFIRFRKVNAVEKVISFVWKSVLLEAILLSIIAITRISVDELLISVLILVAVAYLSYHVFLGERELENQAKENE